MCDVSFDLLGVALHIVHTLFSFRCRAPVLNVYNNFE